MQISAATARARAEELVDQLETLYQASLQRLRAALREYLQSATPPPASARLDGSFTYPELRLHFRPTGRVPKSTRAFATLDRVGTYTTTVTRPAQFRPYLVEQLEAILGDYDVQVDVGPSRQEIPFAYVLDASLDLNQADVRAEDLARHFPATQLRHIGDELVDALLPNAEGHYPLALFDGLRTDFSLARLRHYTGAPAEHVQPYILFTNYHRYVDEFVAWALAELRREGSPWTALSCAGGVLVTRGTPDAEAAVSAAPWRKHQMPAWHLLREDGHGVSLVNIGVGPSNAKNICDHLAVLRPHAWLMIGHCGGLRHSQTIGDYVLAHAYLRDDHVLDDVLPPSIPIPSLAEVQRALYDAAKQVAGESGSVLKRRLRTGTVATTDDRNWELRYTLSVRRFNQARAIAIDMESATIAAQGYRFRVPYGTLLCVSDKPLHGELKLPGQANAFYERAIAQHLRIGLATVDLLREEGEALHSRKLRAFDEVPFR
ncbi:MAG: hypothetical protein RL026_2838 [Pseudomonadota bacterium]